MSDNLDEWLNSLGVESTDTPATILESPSPVVVDSERSIPVNATNEEPQTQTLSDSDFDDILGDFGFTRPEDADAEELPEDDEEEENSEIEETPVSNSDIRRFVHNLENAGIISHETGEQAIIDLNAEEDADSQALVDSGGVVPVEDPIHTGRGLLDQIRDAGTIEPIPMTSQDIEEALRDMHHRQMAELTMQQETPSTPEEAAGAIASSRANVARRRARQQARQQETSVSQEEPLIPMNSPTLLLDESTSRFSGAEWYNEIQKKSIIVAGIGGIGRMKNFL